MRPRSRCARPYQRPARRHLRRRSGLAAASRPAASTFGRLPCSRPPCRSRPCARWAHPWRSRASRLRGRGSSRLVHEVFASDENCCFKAAAHRAPAAEDWLAFASRLAFLRLLRFLRGAPAARFPEHRARPSRSGGSRADRQGDSARRHGGHDLVFRSCLHPPYLNLSAGEVADSLRHLGTRRPSGARGCRVVSYRLPRARAARARRPAAITKAGSCSRGRLVLGIAGVLIYQPGDSTIA